MWCESSFALNFPDVYGWCAIHVSLAIKIVFITLNFEKYTLNAVGMNLFTRNTKISEIKQRDKSL